MTDLTAAADYFAKLHSLAMGEEGVLVLAAFGENLAPKIRHFEIGDAQGMTDTAAGWARQEGYNIYTPTAVMRLDLAQSSKGTEKDVVAMLGYVADFDKGLGESYAQRCPFMPSYVLETSPGNAQCFFLLERPLRLESEAARADAKELAVRLTKSCDGSDPVGADLSHVWRVPGLDNYPNAKKLREGRDPKPFTVRVVKPFEKTVSVTDIRSLTVPTKPGFEPSTATCVLERKQAIQTANLIATGHENFAKTVMEGAPVGQRSEAVSSLVWALLRQGHATGDIADLIAAHPAGIGARYNCDRGRIEADVLRLAQKKADADAQDNKPRRSYSLEELQDIDEESIPQRSWLLGHHLLKGKVTVLVAPPGVGKSTFALTAAASVATGRNLLDLCVHETGAVAVINNEDDMDEMRRRLAAIKKFHKISHAELAGKFYLQSGATQTFVIAKRDKDKALSAHHRDDLIAFCKSKGVKALFVDPFLETHEADENDNRQINEVARMYREVAQQADCAVCIVHHTRKQQGQSSAGHAGNMDSGRGASSLIGAARIVVTLYDMSEADAKLYAISGEERHLYVRLDDAKANMSLKSNQITWYKREGATLANGETVGVLAVARTLHDALAIAKTAHTDLLFIKVATHRAFKPLREKGSMSRESFISAMVEASAWLGKPTETRSTLQERLEKYLLGKGINSGPMQLSMKKKANFFTISFIDAGSPDDAGKEPAGQAGFAPSQVLPEAAEKIRLHRHNIAGNLDADSPPL